MKRFHQSLNLNSVMILLAVGVLLPVMLSTAVGIVALVIAKDVGGIVLGVLVLSFAVAAMGSALVTVVLTGRKARLARLQADFVANISHEFRTPLSAIRLYTQTLQSGKLADDPRQTAQCLDTILRETEWLDVMIDKVLTWRASARDMLKLEMDTAPVTRAVSEAVDRFRSLAGPDGSSVTCALTTRLPVRHDARAITSVVLNLLTNAYKYSGRDKQIRVGARDEAGQVVIEVQDNGIGMSPAEVRHIFQPFYRVERRDGGSVGGVGLGLAIVQYMVSRHGGRITVRSEPGKGTTFTVHLPAAEGHA